jgi:hypothetical protein
MQRGIKNEYDFFVCAIQFQKKKFSSQDARMNAARTVYNRFLVEDAPQEIGVERQNLRSITAALNKAPYNIFQDALLQVSSMLAAHFLNYARENGMCVATTQHGRCMRFFALY